MRNSFGAIVLGIVGLTLTGPVLASMEQDGLTRVSSPSFDQVYVNHTRHLRDVQLGEVSLDMNGLDQYNLGRSDLERLRDEFAAALGANAADDTARVAVDVRLTEIIPNRSYASFGTRISRHHNSIGSGSAAIEATYRDVETGEILMVIIDERSGPSFFGPPSRVNAGDWEDAEEILSQWAEELPQAL